MLLVAAETAMALSASTTSTNDIIVITEQVDQLLLELPSLASSVQAEAQRALGNFVQQQKQNKESASCNPTSSFAENGVHAAEYFCQSTMMLGGPSVNKLQVRRRLETMSADLYHASFLALCLVLVTLALNVESNANDNDAAINVAAAKRAAASAIASTMEKKQHLRHHHGNQQHDDDFAFSKQDFVFAVIHLGHALTHRDSAGETKSNQELAAAAAAIPVVSMDLHIIVQLAKALRVDSCHTDSSERVTCELIQAELNLDRDDKKSKNDNNDDHGACSVLSIQDDLDKTNVAAALALAAQLKPWKGQLLSPAALIHVAIHYDLWHAAEKLCSSTIIMTTSMNAAASIISMTAARTLIDAALEAKTYRRADTYATDWYDLGGPFRFLEARFLHACDTIAKVIRKRALPVIEKQVERVDNAVNQVRTASSVHQQEVNVDSDIVEDPRTTVDTASQDIRNFALRQLEESSDIDGAHRLASIWKMDYVYDEEVLKAAIAARRKKYLQWDDVFPNSSVPGLLSTPEDLTSAFEAVMTANNDDNVFGFDVEWGDDTGAALLQLATCQSVMLIDIPALSKSVQGVQAMEKTIGRLFSRNDNTAVVVGFSCRQDLSRLKATPIARHATPWLADTSAVIDLQAMAIQIDSTLGVRGFGLSKCTERILGKPLDKSEQCSLWTRRPLVQQQREYAALDAYVCSAMYKQLSKTHSLPTDEATKKKPRIE